MAVPGASLEVMRPYPVIPEGLEYLLGVGGDNPVNLIKYWLDVRSCPPDKLAGISDGRCDRVLKD